VRPFLFVLQTAKQKIGILLLAEAKTIFVLLTFENLYNSSEN